MENCITVHQDLPVSFHIPNWLTTAIYGDLCKNSFLKIIGSSNFLVNNAVKEIQGDIVSQLTVAFKNRIHELQPEDIIAAAKSGDEYSISLLNKIGLAVGKGLSFTIQLLNPEIIVWRNSFKS